MGSESLRFLISRKATVNLNISNTKGKISALEDKISRLETAKSSLNDSIINLESIKGDVDSFEIANAKWQGETERSFIGKYNSYGIFLGIYKSDTEKALDQIDEALQSAKQEKGTAELDLGNYETILTGLETDIKVARETV